MVKLALLILVLAWVCALPRWPHSRAWGPMPSIVLLAAFVALLALVVAGRV